MMNAKGLAAAGRSYAVAKRRQQKTLPDSSLCNLWLPLPLPSPSDSIDAAGEATRAGIMHVKIGHLAIGKKLLD
jgi:hypothetical protein